MNGDGPRMVIVRKGGINGPNPALCHLLVLTVTRAPIGINGAQGTPSLMH